MTHEVRCGSPGCGALLQTTENPHAVLTRAETGALVCSSCGAKWRLWYHPAPSPVRLGGDSGDVLNTLRPETVRWLNRR